MIIYAMSDIHGCLDAFEYALSLVDLSGDNKLVLLRITAAGQPLRQTARRRRQMRLKHRQRTKALRTAVRNRHCAWHGGVPRGETRFITR